MRARTWLALALCTSLVVAGGAADAAKKKKGKGKKNDPVTMTAETMQWKEAPKAKGVSMSVLWGNPKRGSYGAYIKWAAGTEHPMHFHSRPARVVMISGTMTVTTDDGKTFELKPGGYGFMPGRRKHTSACKEECVYFVFQPGAFDFKPVKAKKKPAAAAEPKKEEGEKKAE